MHEYLWEYAALRSGSCSEDTGIEMNIVVSASGGGHTGRAAALGHFLRTMNGSCSENLYFVIRRGDKWTSSKVGKLGGIIEVRSIRNVNESIVKGIIRLPAAFIDAWRRLPSSICSFVSMGASISIPAAITAKLRGARIYNVETIVRFVKPSLTARALRPISDVTVLHWEEQRKIHPGGIVYGPLYPPPLHEPRDDGYVLVTGGSYGFPELFRTVSELGLDRVVMQTGRIDPEPLKKRNPGWIVFRFDPEFDKWLARAHIVITHFGNTAVEAALTYHKPVIMVYNPAWRTAAGLEDAKIFAKKINAVFLPKPPTREELRAAIREAENTKPPRYPNGAEKLAKELKELCCPGL